MIPRVRAIALLLFVGGALVAQAAAVHSLRERLHREYLAAADVALGSLAATLTRAERLGIPLERVVGLDELVRTRRIADSGIVRLRLLDKRGRILWESGLEPVAERARDRTLEAPIGGRGMLEARFVPRDTTGECIRLLAALLAVTAALAVPLWTLARWHDLMREEFTDGYLHRQIEAILRRDLRITWWSAGLGSSDPRLQLLRDQVFLVNEQHRRVARRVDSLRRTEPEAQKRRRMGALLESLERGCEFAGETGPIDRRVWPGQATARCVAVVAAVLAGVPLAAGVFSGHPAGMAIAAVLTLVAWIAGFVAGALPIRVRWFDRLRVALLAAAFANLLTLPAIWWVGVCAAAFGGLATALGVCAAVETAGVQARKAAIEAGLSAPLAGAVLGWAAATALAAFVDARWAYLAASLLAAFALAWLSYRLSDPPAARASAISLRRRLRIRIARRREG
ncbi:MAG: hypothetical protein WDO68_04190 [Gammaproteobacteria bacterium]